MSSTEPQRAFGITVADEARAVAKRWWLISLLGLVTMLLGLVLLANLATAVGALSVLVAVALLVEGVDDIALAVRHRVRWPSYAIGALWLAAGLVTLVWPGITLLALAVVVGIGFVIAGAAQLGAAVALRRGLPMWGLWATIGVLTLAVGVIALVLPDLTILTLAAWLGIGLLLRGLGTLWFSVPLRRLSRSN